jgi:rhodanese-related sulfurtransferase
MFHMPLSIAPIELKARLDRGEKLVVVDVREKDEYDYVHLDCSVWIPLRELPRRMDELDPASEMVVLCHLGIRSFQAQLFLQEKGFTNVSNLSGGIDAWAAQVDPKMKRYR